MPISYKFGMLNLAKILLLTSLLFVQSFHQQHHYSSSLTKVINHKTDIYQQSNVQRVKSREDLKSEKISLLATITYDYPLLDRIDKVKSLLLDGEMVSVYDNCTVLDAVETMNAQNKGSVLILGYCTFMHILLSNSLLMLKTSTKYIQ